MNLFRDPRARRALLTTVLCCLVVVCGHAVAAARLADDYRHLFETGAGNGAFGEIAVGLIDGKAQGTWFFGRGTGSATPGGDSVFEIGAATDVFTGLLLAQAALDGKVRLRWPLRRLVPADFPWHDQALANTTLLDLGTQQSRLPATPANLFPADADDPYAGYGESDLLAWLANSADSATRAGAGYSVLNGGTLATMLARVYGDDFAALLRARVFVPLGMAHTGFADADGLLPGHAFGKESPHWHYAALAGAAGLRSTLNDLLAFVRANLQPEGSSLRGALLLARQPHVQTAAGGLGLGWNVHELATDEQTWPLVWRASVTGGFSTFVGFRTDRQQGLVLLASSAIELAPIGVAWLSGQPAPPAPAAPFVPAPGRADLYPGLYDMLDGSELTIRHSAGALTAQLRGQPAWKLFPVAEDVYATGGGAVGITFIRNIDQISGLLMHADGTYITGRRLSAGAPRLPRGAMHIAAGKLQEYTGDFQLDANAQVRLSRSGDGLVMHFTGAAPVPMHAFAPDRFAGPDGVDQLTFQRDDRGHIDALKVDLAGGERKALPIDWRTPHLPAYTAPGD